ncbi:MAG: DUF6037 family protein, partial [Bacillota bacterium]
SMAYNQFKEYFGIGSEKGEFSIKDFVSHLSGQVPLKYCISDEKRKTILRYDRLDNEGDGIYPIGLTNWEVVHVKNPKLPNDKYHRTAKNLAKTKELYPEIYKATKDLDITIIYGVEPNEKTGDIKSGRW